MSFIAVSPTSSSDTLKRRPSDHINTDKEKSGCCFGRKYTIKTSDDTLSKSRPVHTEEVKDAFQG